VLTNNKKECII